MHGWYFRPKVKGEVIREPIYGEFFATDAISDPGMALVREGIPKLSTFTALLLEKLAVTLQKERVGMPSFWEANPSSRVRN
jgi:hypothetical protein